MSSQIWHILKYKLICYKPMNDVQLVVIMGRTNHVESLRDGGNIRGLFCTKYESRWIFNQLFLSGVHFHSSPIVIFPSTYKLHLLLIFQIQDTFLNGKNYMQTCHHEQNSSVTERWAGSNRCLNKISLEIQLILHFVHEEYEWRDKKYFVESLNVSHLPCLLAVWSWCMLVVHLAKHDTFQALFRLLSG